MTGAIVFVGRRRRGGGRCLTHRVPLDLVRDGVSAPGETYNAFDRRHRCHRGAFRSRRRHVHPAQAVIFLASLRSDKDLAATVDGAIKDWLPNRPKEVNEVWVISSAYHQTNRIYEAINTIRRALSDKPLDAKFNVLYRIWPTSLSRAAFTSPTRQSARKSPICSCLSRVALHQAKRPPLIQQRQPT